MRQARRVVITGYGSVSALDQPEGTDHMRAWVERQSTDAEMPARERANQRPVTHLDAEPYIDPNQLRRADRFCQMTVVAAVRALQSCALAVDDASAGRTGLVLNTCFGPMQSTDAYIKKMIRTGAKRAPAALFPYTVYNAGTGVATMAIQALGTNSTISGCSAASYGVEAIRQGTDDTMLVGGCEELSETIVKSFVAAGFMSGLSAEPPQGFTLGEGAAVAVLEDYDSAIQRGVTPLAEILDYGTVHHTPAETLPYHVSADSVERAIRQALEHSGVDAGEIDIVVPAANGVTGLGAAEEQALDRVFGDRSRPRVIDPKPWLGETLGAAATFSLIAAVVALHSGVPAGNHPAPQYALVNSCELGGSITSIVVRRADLPAATIQ